MRIAILGSTNGSIVPKLAEGLKDLNLKSDIKFDISLIISNKEQAGILGKAKALDIKHKVCLSRGLEREVYDAKLTQILEDNNIDLILLVGFMRILSADFCRRWHKKVLNIHPSLLPKYQGLMDLSVHQAVLDNNDTETGCSVHWVTEDVDCGPVLAQRKVPVLANDDANSLKARVQAEEVGCYSDALVIIFEMNKATR
jgi:phosphoribosylglycinamide formyltransferase 1